MNKEASSTKRGTGEIPAVSEDLLRRAKAGDREALEEIYLATAPEVWRTVCALLRQEQDAADVMQDTYLKAFSRLDQLESAGSLGPWVRQIAANTARDHLRRKKPLLFSDLQAEDGPLPEQEDDRLDELPEASLDRSETRRLVREMLDTLTDAQRLVIGMYYYQELSVREIAAQLEIPQATVKGQLRLGRQKIEKQVRRLEEQGVRLCGAAPLAFFRWAFRECPDIAEAPKPSAALSGSLPSQTVSAQPTALRAVTAKGLLTKRLLLSAAALAAAGGVAAGVLALRGNRGVPGDVQPPQPSEVSLVLHDASPEDLETDPPVTEPTVTQPYSTEPPATEPPVDEPPEVESRLQIYEDWQDAYLGVLAGTAKPVPEDGQDWFIMEPGVYYSIELGAGPRAGCWYLGDFDGDGVPQLMLPYGLNGEVAMYLYDNTDEGVTEQRADLGPNTLYRARVSDAGEDRLVTILYSPELGYIHYNEGVIELTVGPISDGGQSRWGFYDELSCWPMPGEDFRDAPDYGALSRKQEASYQVRYELYGWGSHLIEHLTLTQTGDEYFFVDYACVGREAYRAKEQEAIRAATWRSIDETKAARLQQIPGGEITGPLSAKEVAELLGGFAGRPEWEDARQRLEACVPYGLRFLPLISDPAPLARAIRETYPDCAVGAGEWSFAVVCADRDEDGSSAAILALYRQTPEEGGDTFAAVIRYTNPVSGRFDFLRIPYYADYTGYLWNDRLYFAQKKQLDGGEKTVYLDPSSLLPIYAETGREVIYPVILRSAAELEARLTENPDAETVDLGAPVRMEPRPKS